MLDACNRGRCRSRRAPRQHRDADAIDEADVIVLAVCLDTIEELAAQYAPALDGEVVIAPSSPIGVDDEGQIIRTVSDGQPAGSVVTALIPASARYAKALGTLSATALIGSFKR